MLSDPYAIQSIRYPIHIISDQYAIQSIWYLIHTLSDPYAIWSIRYLIHSLSYPYAILSIRYPIHMLSDPCVVNKAEVPINLSRKTIEEYLLRSKRYLYKFYIVLEKQKFYIQFEDFLSVFQFSKLIFPGKIEKMAWKNIWDHYSGCRHATVILKILLESEEQMQGIIIKGACL